ncbi:phospholipase, partial [Yersinia pestis]|nr:phospholipase [Yersinia pestis]
MSASVSLTTPVSVSCLINDVNPSGKAKKEYATAVTTTKATTI